MSDLIEKLQDKTYVRAFGLMTPEEKMVYDKVGIANCLVYNGTKNKWKQPDSSGFLEFMEYAIKPDYQPEPEYVDLEIIEQEGWLGISQHSEVSYQAFTYLHYLPSLSNFEEFWYENNITVFIDNVANKMSQGHKVYARFRVENDITDKNRPLKQCCF